MNRSKKKCVTYVFSLFVNEIRTDIENDHGVWDNE
jgi:hypothetical protein